MIPAIRSELLKLRTARLPWGLLAATVGLATVHNVLFDSNAGGTGHASIPPLSTYSGSGVVKLTDGDGNWCLPEVGADLYVVRVIRSSAFDLENFAPIRRELPGPQSLVAKP